MNAHRWSNSTESAEARRPIPAVMPASAIVFMVTSSDWSDRAFAAIAAHSLNRRCCSQ